MNALPAATALPTPSTGASRAATTRSAPAEPERTPGFLQALGTAREGRPGAAAGVRAAEGPRAKVDGARDAGTPPADRADRPDDSGAPEANDDTDTRRATAAGEPAPDATATTPPRPPADAAASVALNIGIARPLAAGRTEPPVAAPASATAADLDDGTVEALVPGLAPRTGLAGAGPGPRTITGAERPERGHAARGGHEPQSATTPETRLGSSPVALPGTAVEAPGSVATTRPAESPGFAAALVAAQPVPAAATPAGPPAAPLSPAEATLAAPPGSPAFAPELAARVTTFVRGGIEHAELQLNPAEMGPVEVRIRLDGDAARVVLAADQAPTRQWLEQALPALAGSLREAGLTLAGGGVFDRAPGGGTGGGNADAGRQPGTAQADGAAAGGGAAERPLEPAQRRRGVVDLVA